MPFFSKSGIVIQSSLRSSTMQHQRYSHKLQDPKTVAKTILRSVTIHRKPLFQLILKPVSLRFGQPNLTPPRTNQTVNPCLSYDLLFHLLNLTHIQIKPVKSTTKSRRLQARLPPVQIHHPHLVSVTRPESRPPHLHPSDQLNSYKIVNIKC